MKSCLTVTVKGASYNISVCLNKKQHLDKCEAVTKGKILPLATTL